MQLADAALRGLPLGRGAEGEAVRDLQRRLTTLGYDVPPSETGRYRDHTVTRVEQFQQARGLDVDGVCGPQTWGALVEAGYQLGDRLLYLRSPMLRGDDVAALQQRLGALGFDAGRVDGILGPDTEQALRDFQRNMGLTTDAVCGRDTLAALARLGEPDHGAPSVRVTREREALRGASRQLHDRRIVLGEAGGLGALVGAIGRNLQEQGAMVATVHHPDHAVQATQANDFKGDVFLGLSVDAEPGCRPAFFSVPGFSSVGGERLATLICEEIPPVLGLRSADREGMRLPILRETRMPAVACRIGPADQVVAQASPLAAAFVRSLYRWVQEPVEL